MTIRKVRRRVKGWRPKYFGAVVWVRERAAPCHHSERVCWKLVSPQRIRPVQTKILARDIKNLLQYGIISKTGVTHWHGPGGRIRNRVAINWILYPHRCALAFRNRHKQQTGKRYSRTWAFHELFSVPASIDPNCCLVCARNSV